MKEQSSQQQLESMIQQSTQRARTKTVVVRLTLPQADALLRAMMMGAADIEANLDTNWEMNRREWNTLWRAIERYKESYWAVRNAAGWTPPWERRTD
jgi:hypothetical protein